MMAVATGGVWAEHGGTEDFERRNREAREAANGKVVGERLKVFWDAEALYHEKPGGGWVKVRLTDGAREDVEKRPESAKPGDDRGDRRRGRGGRDGRRGGSGGPVSPDKRWEVTVKDGKVELAAQTEDGESQTIEIPRPDDWVLKDDVLWSPHSDRFVVWRRPDVPLRQVHYVRSSPEDQLQPEHFTKTYTKPGDPLNIARPVVCFTDGREPMLLDEDLSKNPYQLRNVRWRRDGKRLTVEFVERGFGVFRVIEMDTGARKQRTVVEEVSDKFVFVSGKTFRHDYGDGKEIVWMSERDGWNHLYLMDGATGGVRRQLTKGEWVVREVVDVAEMKGKRSLLVKLGGYYPDQDPYFIHWARVGVDDGTLTMLTEADGTHEVEFGPGGEYYVARWSRVDHPPVHELRRSADGALVTELARADASKLAESGWIAPEPFKTTDRNGKYDIWGVIHRPRNFDATKKYPVVEKIYAGPHGAFVPKSWRTWHGTGAEMCEAGFIVVQIDGLGTSHRSREFHQVAYKNLMDSGFPDRVKWIRAAAAKYPQLDVSRVGIFGGSAGGQSTLAALLTHGDFYQAGVADCGCHDNRMDKTWWNEQWMDWPVDESYAQNSNVTHAEKLQGALLLTVGEVDTNVDPSSTMQVVDALIEADKDFEMLLVPNGGHGVGEKPYLRRKRIEFFQRELGRPEDRS